jgi:hypothetical protein
MHPIIKKRLLAKIIPTRRRITQADRDHAALVVLIERQASLLANRKRSSHVQSLPAPTPIGELSDLEYFTNKLAISRAVPSSYLLPSWRRP